MSNWIYLEVAIGLVLVYFIVSLLCTAITEWIARILALRAKTLKDGIYNLLDSRRIKETDIKKNTATDAELQQFNYIKTTILGHPLFNGLSAKTPRVHWWDNIKLWNWEVFTKNEYGPSEIPPAIFSQIILDTLVADGKTIDKDNEKLLTNLGKSIDSLKLSDDAKKLFKSFLTTAKTKATEWQETIKEFRTSLEKWFDDSMQRVTGWYKRKTQLIVLGLALVICFTLNIDSFGIAKSLYSNPALRETVVAAAEAQVTANPTAETANLTFNQTLEKLDALNLPIGWNPEKGTANSNPDTNWGWLLKIAGILVTAFAVSLGSGFWYDLLKKLVNIRAAGKTPEKTEETKSNSA